MMTPSAGSSRRRPSTGVAFAVAASSQRDRAVEALELGGGFAEVDRDDGPLTAPPGPGALWGRKLHVGAGAEVGQLLPERDQVPREVERGLGVFALVVNVAARVLERQPRILPPALARPGHRRTARVARGHGDVAHPFGRHVAGGQRQLVAVVERRSAAEGQERQQRAARECLVAAAPASREASHVVVGADPARPGARWQRGLRARDYRAQLLGIEGRVDEREVEGEVQLVRARAVIAGPGRDVEDVDLPQQHARWFEGVGQTAPVAVDLVRLRSVQGVNALASDVVAQLAILHQPVGDVDAEAGHAALEPEAKDALELGAHLRVPPVEVRLLLREVVEVVPPALSRPAPRPTRRRRSPASCSEPRPPRRRSQAALGTRDADPRCGSGRGRGAPGCRARVPRRPAVPRPPASRDRGGHRCSR